MSRASQILTYFDLLERLTPFVQGRANEAPQEVLRGAIQEAYDDIVNAHLWNSMIREGRVHVHARQITGTAAYDHAGGSSERLVTLTGGGTFDSDWMANAAIRLGTNSVSCDIEEVLTSTTATLNLYRNPGRDISAGTYAIYERWVALPPDFETFAVPMAEGAWQFGQAVSQTEMLALDRYNNSSGKILHHCVAEVPDVYGLKGLYIWPQQISEGTIDFAYKRRGRPLQFTGQDAIDSSGTVSITAASAAVTGSGTSFNTDMIGAIFRVSRTTTRPTGRGGLNPFAEERSVKSVTDTTHLTLDAPVVNTYSGLGYSIADPVDVPPVARTAMIRAAKVALLTEIAKSDEDLAVLSRLTKQADRALLEAMAADEPTFYDPMQDQPSPRPFAHETVVIA